MNQKKPPNRALRDFKPLMPGELVLLNACREGEIANLGDATPESATNGQRVRAEFVRFLLLGGDERAPVHERGVQLRGAFFEGPLDLRGCCIEANVSLTRCLFGRRIYAVDARVDGLLNLQGSHLAHGLAADRLRCSAGVFLRRGFKSMGEVSLRGAHIGGNLDCTGGQFEVAKGDAFSADGSDVRGNVFLRDSFKATGEVRLLGVQVGRNLDCSGGRFEVTEGHALSADGADVKGDVSMSRGFKAMGEIRLPGAKVGGDLNCSGGQFEVKEGTALSVDRANVKGCVFLCDGLKATGVITLLGAQIGGDLNCNDAQFRVKKGHALSADGSHVNGDISLGGDFEATGEISLLGTQIGGDLNCGRGQFEVMAGNALSADRANVKGSVFLRNGFRATGEVRLLGTQIGGSLSCTDGRFDVKDGNALSADRANIKGNVSLNDGFRATGEVRLVGTQIGGSLSCTDGQFEVKKGDALSADRAYVKGSVFLRDGFKATGEVRLLGIQIGGNLNCSGGQFEAKEGAALSAGGAEVKGDVSLSPNFKAMGEVRLVGTQIGGSLSCRGGQFEATNGNALSANRANIKGNVSMSDGFRATGQVRLQGTQIGGNLDCSDARFEALSLHSAVVRGAWRLNKSPQPVLVNASHADVAVLVDDLNAWASGSVLDGLRYAAFGGEAPTRGMDRLTWLCSQSEKHLGDTGGGADFRPQPWRQLQRVLREMGHTEDAKQVGIAFEDRLRAMGRLGESPQGTPAVPAWLKRVVAQGAHYTFGKLAGYGYRPINLVAWMVAVWFACGMAYWWLALPPRSAMAPSDPLVFQNVDYDKCQPDQPREPGNWYLCGPLRGEYATFSPFAFSLDLMLPVVDLGQEKTWGAFVPTPKESPLDELFWHWHWGHAARLLTWLQTLFGWLSSLLLVAIVSGFSRRNDEGS